TARQTTPCDKLPVGHVPRRPAQIIKHSRRTIQPRAPVKGGLGPLVSEDVLKMVCAKWAAILPLRITSAIAFANGDPAVPAHRLSLARISLFEPGDNQRRFRLELAMRHIVVGKRT